MPTGPARRITILSAPARWARARMAVTTLDLKVRGNGRPACRRRVGNAIRPFVHTKRTDYHDREKASDAILGRKSLPAAVF